MRECSLISRTSKLSVKKDLQDYLSPFYSFLKIFPSLLEFEWNYITLTVLTVFNRIKWAFFNPYCVTIFHAYMGIKRKTRILLNLSNIRVFFALCFDSLLIIQLLYCFIKGYHSAPFLFALLFYSLFLSQAHFLKTVL